MRRPSVWMLALGLLCAGAAGVLVLRWTNPTPVFPTILRADRLTVLEGLPHPSYEGNLFGSESKIKPTMTLSGFPFYREPLDLTDEDRRRLRSLLGDPRTFQTYSGEKKCGEFHADYAVEWVAGGLLYRCLICFGCSEAKIEGPPGAWSFHDLRSEGRGRDRGMKLLDLLKKYRKNRPPHERFGLGPLAGRYPFPAELQGSSN